MISRTIKVPFHDLMETIENFLSDEHYIKEDEFMMYADLGLPVDENGNIELDIELEDMETIEELTNE